MLFAAHGVGDDVFTAPLRIAIDVSISPPPLYGGDMTDVYTLPIQHGKGNFSHKPSKKVDLYNQEISTSIVAQLFLYYNMIVEIFLKQQKGIWI